MLMKTIASSGHGLEKSKVNKSLPNLLIKYGHEVYEINRAELRNLGLDHIDEVVEKAHSLGQDPMPAFSQNCLFCGNNANSIGGFYSGNGGDPNKGIDCRYKSDEVQIAYQFEGKITEPAFRAIQDCAFYDSIVKVLVEKRVLDDYKVHKPFNYRNIDDFKEGKASPKDFKVKRKGFKGKLKDLISK
jgi:hypothetical protein